MTENSAYPRGFGRIPPIGRWLFVPLFSIFVVLAAVDPVSARSEAVHINVDSDGYAIGRYDPVAYFTEGRPVRGVANLWVEHEGAKYAFSSEANRRLFLADPAKYVPQYGGYCAYGVVYGSKSDIDPELWEIVDGRLFLLINPGTMKIWQRKKKANIAVADKAWMTIIRSN